MRCSNCDSDIFVEDQGRGDQICLHCGYCVSVNHRNNNDDHINDDDQNHNESSLTGKNTQIATNYLNNFKNIFSLGEYVMNTAYNLLTEIQNRKIKENKRVYGIKTESFSLAILYCAMNLHRLGKTLREICETTDIDERTTRFNITRIHKMIPDKLTTNSTVEDFIRVIVLTIGCSFELEKYACDIAKRALNHSCDILCTTKPVNGRPTTIAACAVLMAATKYNIEINSEDVCIVVGLDMFTLENRIKRITGHLNAMYFDELLEFDFG